MRAIALIAAAAVSACQTAPVVTQSRIQRAPVIVRVWLTTGDRERLLAREPDLQMSSDTAASTFAASVIDVDESRTYQQMIGFGAAMSDASAHVIMHRMQAGDREALMQDLFGRERGIGLSFVRLPMGASDFSLRHYSYDDMPGSQIDPALTRFSIAPDRAERIPLVQRALAINPEIKLVGSPWSPPAWMKSSGSLIKGTLLPRFYDSFADYFVKFIQAYAAEGLPIYAVTIQNEPNHEPADYPGMRLDAKQRARIVGWHLGPRFERAAIRTMIWDWDHNWDLSQDPLEMLADSTARKYVQGIAWHCYAGDVSAQSLPHHVYPDKDTYFTECSGGEWATNFADNLKWNIRTLVIGATRNWARGVALWNLALDEKGGPHLGGCGNCRGVVTIDSKTGAYTRNVEYYVLGHASKFVRSGAYRIESQSADTTLANVAFRNPDGDGKVLIVLNGAKEARAFIVRASGRAFRYVLPAESVVTLTWT
jgi:glucosylceramidase